MNPAAIIRLLRKARVPERWTLHVFLTLAVALPAFVFLVALRRSLADEAVELRKDADALLIERLPAAQAALAAHIGRNASLAPHAEDARLTHGERFTRAAAAGHADAVILLDASGRPAYPVVARMRAPDDIGPADRLALDLRENLATSADRAATWKSVAAQEKQIALARDTAGRLILPSLQLFAIEHAKLDVATRATALASLRAVIADRAAPMPSSQRLFLAQELRRLDSEFALPAASAELLATEVLQRLPPRLTPGVLTRAISPADCWLLLGTDRIAIFTGERLRPELREILRRPLGETELGIRVRPAGEVRAADIITTAAAGATLPDWEIHFFRPEEAGNPVARQRAWIALAIFAAAATGAGIAGFLVLRRHVNETRSTQLRHDFLSTVSHELKTPLTSIRLLVDTLQGGQWQDRERTRQYSEVMQREVAKLSHLLDSFLTYTRLERGKLRFDFTETDPARVAEHAAAIIGAKFRGHAAFSVDIEPELPMLHADSDTLVTAVLNLLDNAYKFSPEGRRIALRVTRAGRHVCFAVEDTGMGLSPADCARVLNGYHRVDSHETRGIGGTGLGLSIVKNVAAAHDGDITVRSELGKGSCFTIHIPIHNPNEP